MLLDRRSALRLMATGAGTALLSACTPATALLSTPTAAPAPKPTSPDATVSTPAASETQPVAQPRSGGTLRSTVSSDPATLDGHIWFSYSFQTAWLVFDRLTAYDKTLKPQAMLAETWEVNPDYTQVKLNLRRGVQFHSGRELTSDDIKYNVVRSSNPGVGAGQLANQSKWFTSIETPDKYTAILKSDVPRPLIFDYFEYFNIVDKDAAEGPDAKTKPVGTGPFSLLEWVPGDHLTFNKNKNYWQFGKPYLDSVTVAVVRDLQAMVAQLEAGAVDVIPRPPLRDLARLKSDPRYQAQLLEPSGSFAALGFNCSYAPLSNKLVRQALNYAMDRQRIIDTALLGFSSPQNLPWPTTSVASEPSKDKTYTFDLDKAAALLKQANVGDFAMDMYTMGNVEGPIVGQIYQADLAKIGVTLTIQDVTAAVWADQINNVKYQGQWWSSLGLNHLAPGTMLATSVPYNPALPPNNCGFSDATYSSLVDASLHEIDASKQKAIYSQLNDFLLDQSFVAPIGQAPITQLATSKVHDLTPTLHQCWLYTDAWRDG